LLGKRLRSPLIKSLTALALVLIAAQADAQPVPLADYRHYLQQGVDAGVYQEVAAGWIDAGNRQTWHFGRDAQPDNARSFEIGAATEIFTGLLLAQAAYEGKVRLQTPLRDLLPQDFAFADPTLGAITLQELATHHTGLPALPPNLLPANADDPYADYSEADLRAFLANYRRTETDSPSMYSTLDAGLLGNVLGRAYAQKYTELLEDEILKPLGLENTNFEDTLGLAVGHARGTSAPHWHYGALAGAAGLRASVGDLLVFLQQNLQPQASPRRAALLLARQAQSGTKQDSGLGWNIVEVQDGVQSWPLVWRASRTAGFAAFLGFRTDRQQALVLLGNADADLSALGIAWLEQRAPPPAPERPPAPPQSIALDAYPGLYQVRGGLEMIVRADAQGLVAQVRGQPAQPVRAIGHDAFVGEAYALMFDREGGKVAGVLIDQGGVHVPARRLSDRAPAIARMPIAVDPKSFGEFAGDYRVDADTLLRIRAGANALTLQMTGRAAFPLAAFAKDRFADAQASCEVTFLRGEHDIVKGLVLNFAGIDRAATRVVWAAPPTSGL
jgi:CubicO group peptidase (beta-lactamase class C family)